MSNMGTLYLYELKKIVNRKIVWIVSLIILSLCTFLSIIDLVSTSTYYGDTEISGYEAMKINRDNAMNFSGRTLDDSLLNEMQENYSYKSTAETDTQTSTFGDQVTVSVRNTGDDEDNTIKEYAPIYSYVQQITEDSDLTLSINSNEFYTMREKAVYQNRSDQMLTEAEFSYWENKNSLLGKPFFYEYVDGWSNLWEYAYTLNYFLFLALAICLSNVFSVEYSRKTDSIILCSKYGKKQLYFAKILAGATFSAISAILIFGITLLASILVYGANGFFAALQIAVPLSSWNVSVGESIWILLLTLIVVSILYGNMVMFLSEVLKSNVAVMAIPVGIMILTMMVNVPYQFRFASQVYDLLPTNLLTKWELWDDRLIAICGRYFTNYQIAPIVYLMVAFLLIAIGKAIYQRHQVQAR